MATDSEELDYAAFRRRIVELEAKVADLTSLVCDLRVFLPGNGEVASTQRKLYRDVQRRADAMRVAAREATA